MTEWNCEKENIFFFFIQSTETSWRINMNNCTSNSENIFWFAHKRHTRRNRAKFNQHRRHTPRKREREKRRRKKSVEWKRKVERKFSSENARKQIHTATQIAMTSTTAIQALHLTVEKHSFIYIGIWFLSLPYPIIFITSKTVKKKNYYCIRLDAVLSAPNVHTERIETTTTKYEADETRSTLTFSHSNIFFFFFFRFFLSFLLPIKMFLFTSRLLLETNRNKNSFNFSQHQHQKQSKQHNIKWIDSSTVFLLFLFATISLVCLCFGYTDSSIKMHAPWATLCV